MSDSPDFVPSFEELAADGDIARLLDFHPVPRKRIVEAGWTPELQREFIARLASNGSPGRACEDMGKNLTGMMKLYRSPLAGSFRESWHAAIDLAKRRRADAVPKGPPAMLKAPSIDDRRRFADRANDAAEHEPAASPDEQWQLMMKLFERYARKLQAERRARREGDIAAADFYLRQATWIEVCLEVGGLHKVLSEATIGGKRLLDVAETPLSRMLDDIRRKMWSGDGERPERPGHLLVDHGECSTEPGEVYGQLSAPPWADPDEWRTLDHKQQRARYAEQRARDAEAYKEWIERATAAWEEREARSGGGERTGPVEQHICSS